LKFSLAFGSASMTLSLWIGVWSFFCALDVKSDGWEEALEAGRTGKREREGQLVDRRNWISCYSTAQEFCLVCLFGLS
jgi:hypothetical protein